MSSPGILYVTGTLTVPVFVPFSAVNLANTSSVTSPTVTLTGSFLPGVVKSGMFSTFVTFPPSGRVISLA